MPPRRVWCRRRVRRRAGGGGVHVVQDGWVGEALLERWRRRCAVHLLATRLRSHPALRRRRPRHDPPRGRARGRGRLQHQRGSAVLLHLRRKRGPTSLPAEVRPPPPPHSHDESHPFCLSLSLPLSLTPCSLNPTSPLPPHSPPSQAPSFHHSLQTDPTPTPLGESLRTIGHCAIGK
jgi:hypothetical protein